MKKKKILIIIAAGILIGGGLAVEFLGNYNPIKKIPVLTLKNLCNKSGITAGCEDAPLSTNPPASHTPNQPRSSISTTSSNPIQSGKIDKHLNIDNTLRDVNFCGRTYKVKQVFIDKVDVVQRIAKLITNGSNFGTVEYKNLAKSICWNIIHNMPSEKISSQFASKEIPVGKINYYVNRLERGFYSIMVGVERFDINLKTNDIYLRSGYDGSLIASIGKLK